VLCEKCDKICVQNLLWCSEKENAKLKAELARVSSERDECRLQKEFYAAGCAQAESHLVQEADKSDSLVAEIEKLKAKLSEALKDKARLDWLATADHWFDTPATGRFNEDTFRAAIDAARDGTK
jgi:hypothetical protein